MHPEPKPRVLFSSPPLLREPPQTLVRAVPSAPLRHHLPPAPSSSHESPPTNHQSLLMIFSRVPFSHSLLLFLAALIAGLLNAVAGGGSFISFPALLFTGVAPIAANATNTAAVWPGTIASTVAYRKVFNADVRRLLPPLVVTGIVGGIVGARILLVTPQGTFLHIVPWLLLGATLLFVFSGRITAWIRGRANLK